MSFSSVRPKKDRTEESKDIGNLTGYFSQLADLEPLPEPKQHELALKFKNGDKQAGQRLIETNLRLVVKLAREYQRDWSEWSDLIQAGNMGLVEALSKYDPERGVRFISYAQYWIRARMMDFLKYDSHPVKMCTTRAGRKLFYHLNKTKAKLRTEGKKPTSERIAEELDLDPRDVEAIGRNLEGDAMSLDMSIMEDESSTIGDSLTVSDENPENRVAKNEVVERAEQVATRFLKQLDDPRKIDIWSRRTQATEPVTLRELGEEWDVSKERIRQVENQMLDEFKSKFKREFGDLKGHFSIPDQDFDVGIQPTRFD